jgi:hypothetical protein
MLPASSRFSFVKENQGADAFLLDLAARIPSGSIVFSDTDTLFLDPFYPGLGHRIVRVDLGNVKMPVLIDAIIREQVPEGESVYYLTQGRRDYMIEVVKTDRLRLEYDVIGPTVTPPPTEIQHRVYDLNLYESKRAPYDPSLGFGSMTIGNSSIAGIEESGFHGEESNERGSFRWTTDSWRLIVPLRESYRPRSVVLNIGDLPPQGSDLLICANGIEIHQTHYGSAPGRIEIDLPADFDDSVLDLQVENDVFVPAEIEGRGSDRRALGLMLYGVTLSDQPASKGNFELGAAPQEDVAEGGFHDTENNEAGLFRWTNGAAWLELPVPAGYVVRSVDVSLLDISPEGTDVEILLNGGRIHKEAYTSPPGRIAIDVADFPPTSEGDVLRLDLRSTTFRPIDLEMGLDERTLGVRLHGIVVTDRMRSE